MTDKPEMKPCDYEKEAMEICEASYAIWNGEGPTTHDECDSCEMIEGTLRARDARRPQPAPQGERK